MIELLMVVAMIGVLSAIAMVGYQRYLRSARTGDAKAIMSALRIAQESYRAETLSYLSCSGALNDYYPRAAPNGKKRHWLNPAHADFACWRMLGLTTDTPTTFVYAVVAGAPGQAPPAPNTVAPAPNWPNPTTEPWFVIQATGDYDNDGTRSLLVTSSFSGEIYVENDGE